MMRELAERLRESGNVCVIAHVSPDGDTLGASLALSLALDSLGIRNEVYCQDIVPRIYQCLPGWERVQTPPDLEYEMAVSIDCSDRERLGSCLTLFDRAKARAVVDHHHTNTGFGDIEIIRPCAATGLIVMDLIQELSVPLSAEIATNLYVALITDTGNFNYSNVDRDAMLAAAELVGAGVDVPGLTEVVFRTRTPERTLLIGRSLSKMELRLHGRVSIQPLTFQDFSETGAVDEDTEGIINYGIECEGVEVAILARETNKGIKFSLRSRGEMDAGKLAAKFGGGGHAAAAGFTLSDEIEPAIESIYLAVERELQSK